MTDSSHTVVRIANSHDQAKVYVALLKAAGIPAFCDPDHASDEFAITQRMMNLSNVQVIVPTSELERAREVLAPMEVSPEELERQALEAGEDREDEPS